MLSHPTLTALEITYHRGLTWFLDVPQLRRLVFVLTSDDIDVISESTKDSISDQLDRSPNLSEFILESPSSGSPLLQIYDQQTLRKYCGTLLF